MDSLSELYQGSASIVLGGSEKYKVGVFIMTVHYTKVQSARYIVEVQCTKLHDE